MQTENYLGGDPISIVCTNITSFMGGRANLWEKGGRKTLGIVDALGKPVESSIKGEC